jgi:hypothetical protein
MILKSICIKTVTLHSLHVSHANLVGALMEEPFDGLPVAIGMSICNIVSGPLWTICNKFIDTFLAVDMCVYKYCKQRVDRSAVKVDRMSI